MARRNERSFIEVGGVLVAVSAIAAVHPPDQREVNNRGWIELLSGKTVPFDKEQWPSLREYFKPVAIGAAGEIR